MASELREFLQKVMIELWQEKLNVKLKLRDEDYDERETDIKYNEELDKVIQSILDYLKYY